MLLLEHPSVYTAGKRTEPWDRPIDGTPVIDVDRGGKITWHGPGQLVGYPILGCPTRSTWWPTCAASSSCSSTCAPSSGVATDPDRRAAAASGCPPTTAGRTARSRAIGIRVARGVTLHGFALNCDCDLSRYDRIVPCGIRDAGVTSLSAELGRQVTVADALPVVERHLPTLLRTGTAAPPRLKRLR